ncbi:MAG: tRNA (adenosine(37)-N6)-threonylcarbamoyltransferase complex ATPase subunit type 1 TsaE [Deltaproteobacteria bacterium]|nr:tRNA (adenosine(37)-N6)-threonylcarbamoyltransferase complex ATPase subunit type 1 TsaE [Deltaproteobacteria bacterium]
MMGKGAPLVLISESPSETFRIGEVLGERLAGGDCVALTGELGSGKTCLTQGIARGLGVSNAFAVTSPTFTILNEYPGARTALYHMDAYRLEGTPDLFEMGYDEYLLGSGVMVIEWAERIADSIPDGAISIDIVYLDETRRRIRISGPGDRIASCEAPLGKWKQ